MIGNLAPDTDAQLAIELACDWRLRYRDKFELRAAGGLLRPEEKIAIASEPTGLNRFLVVDRPYRPANRAS